MELLIYISLLIMLFLTVLTLAITIHVLVSLITRENDGKTYLLTRLFLKLGDEEGLTLEEQQYRANIIRDDIKENSKPFNPHEKYDEDNPVNRLDPNDFDV